MTTYAAERRATRVDRFTGSERAIHWIVALAFFSMLGSGLTMGHRGSFHNLMYGWHLGSAGVLVLGIVLVVLGGNRRVLSRTGRQLRSLNRLDREWLRSVPGALLQHRPQPPAGRFNAGQKVNFLVISFLLTALFASGVGLVLTGHAPHQLFKAAHVAAAYLAVVLVVGHLYMALLNPGTRPALGGMISGKVDRDWLHRHHPRLGDEMPPAPASHWSESD
jgi:formate dehydrogenase subunit gamma